MRLATLDAAPPSQTRPPTPVSITGAKGIRKGPRSWMILTVAYFFAFFFSPRPHRLNCVCPNSRIVKDLARTEAHATGRRPGGDAVL